MACSIHRSLDTLNNRHCKRPSTIKLLVMAIDRVEKIAFSKVFSNLKNFRLMEVLMLPPDSHIDPTPKRPVRNKSRVMIVVVSPTVKVAA